MTPRGISFPIELGLKRITKIAMRVESEPFGGVTCYLKLFDGPDRKTNLKTDKKGLQRILETISEVTK